MKIDHKLKTTQGFLADGNRLFLVQTAMGWILSRRLDERGRDGIGQTWTTDSEGPSATSAVSELIGQIRTRHTRHQCKGTAQTVGLPQSVMHYE